MEFNHLTTCLKCNSHETMLLLPVVEKTGGNLVAPADLSRSADSAEELFNDLAFEFGTE